MPLDTTTPSAHLINKEGLRRALGLSSTRMVDELVRRRKIPFIKLGYRTMRFRLSDVEAALKKLTVRETGQ